MTEQKKQPIGFKKIWGWITNLLLVAIIVILFVPSWRLAFSSTLQKIFMGHTDLEKEISIPVDFNLENWILFDSQQKMHSFSEFKGKPTVLTFWATWCPGCRAEMPQIKALKNHFKDNVQFVSVSNEPYETIKASGEYENHADFIYYSQYFSEQFEFSVYPTTFIIDSEFNIIQKIEGSSKLDSDENIEFLSNL